MYIRISSDGVFAQGTSNIGLFELYTIINLLGYSSCVVERTCYAKVANSNLLGYSF